MNADRSRHEDRFWKIVALCALCLSTWLAFSRGGPPVHADNGGATTAGVIAIMGNNPASEHLYLIDTATQEVLLYESLNGNELKLVQARSYQNDLFCANRALNKELPFVQNGYPARDMSGLVEKLLKQKPQ
jgi:hypothetical protein